MADLLDALQTLRARLNAGGVPREGRRVIVPPRRRPNLRWPTPPPHADPLGNIPGNLQIAYRFRVNGAWENDEMGDVMNVDVSGLDAESAAAFLEEAVAITAERFRAALRDHVRTQVEIAELRTQAQPNRFMPNANTMRQAEQLFTDATHNIDELVRAALRDLQQPPPTRRPQPRGLHEAFQEDSK